MLLLLFSLKENFYLVGFLLLPFQRLCFEAYALADDVVDVVRDDNESEFEGKSVPGRHVCEDCRDV